MVANLRNVDDDFARRVAEGLRLDPLPEPSVPARPPITDLPPSPPLSIVANGPQRFAGRKFGVLVTDGVDAALLKALRKAAAAEGALVELIAPHIGGFVTSDGELIPAHQKVDGGPSVLYDAVVLLMSAEGAALLAADATAKDFVTDAHAHCKFIAYTPDAVALLDAAGVVAAARRRLHRTRPTRRHRHVHRSLSRRPLLGPHPHRRPDLTAALHSNEHQLRYTPARRTSIPRSARPPRWANATPGGHPGGARAPQSRLGSSSPPPRRRRSGSPSPTPTAWYPATGSCASSPTPASAQRPAAGRSARRTTTSASSKSRRPRPGRFGVRASSASSSCAEQGIAGAAMRPSGSPANSCRRWSSPAAAWPRALNDPPADHRPGPFARLLLSGGAGVLTAMSYPDRRLAAAAPEPSGPNTGLGTNR